MKIIPSLDSDLHEYTNPVIEGSFMWFLILYQLLYNERCRHEECLFKLCVYWKGLLLKFYFISCLCYPIFLNNDFMVWYVWSILNPYFLWIMLILRGFSIWYLLEGIVRESVKFLHLSFKNNSIMCCQEHFICFYNKKLFIILVDPWEESMIRRSSCVIFSDNILLNFFTCDKSLHSLYFSYIASLASKFIWNIKNFYLNYTVIFHINLLANEAI